jgi:hypothetical protein
MEQGSVKRSQKELKAVVSTLQLTGAQHADITERTLRMLEKIYQERIILNLCMADVQKNPKNAIGKQSLNYDYWKTWGF